MKKNILICSIIVVLIVLIFVYCANIRETEKNDKIKIVTSFYPMYVASLNIIDGIEEVELKNVTSNITGCVHDYTLTPQEMMSISDAKAIVINGTGMEGFLSDIIKNYSDLIVIDSSNGVKTIEEEKHGVNPHTFVSIDNYIIQVQNIYNGLVKLLPEYETVLTSNKDKYINELEKLKEYGDSKLKSFSGVNVVAIHESFEYFAEDFNLNVIAVIEEEEGTAASAVDMAGIVNDINEKEVKVIIAEKDNSTNTAETIARETNAKLIEFNPSLTGENEKDAYIKDYTNNIDILSNALNGGI